MPTRKDFRIGKCDDCKLGVNYMDVELYCCYSLPLRNFLYENGLRYKLAALNSNSKKLFWVYVKDEKLNELLKRWSASKYTTFSNEEI